MPVNRSLISPTSNPVLERALQEKLKRRSETSGSLGELEPLAVRLGILQNTLKPRFREPQLALFASDHGIAVDGIAPLGAPTTTDLIQHLLTGKLPVSVFARIQSMELVVVDAGVADSLPVHPRLMARKIAHGSRNARVGPAMTVDQAHAAIRAGMEIADHLPGNVIACSGIGMGSTESAALVLSRLTRAPIRELVVAGAHAKQDDVARLLVITQGAQGRHREVSDPVEVLAAFGGFDTAMMVGVMLVAASKRHLIIVDGMAACAALLIASRIAEPVTDYALFTRSHSHQGLDQALKLLHASALLELGMESTDGTGATLAWPLIRAAGALLTEVAEGEEAGPSQPSELSAQAAQTGSAQASSASSSSAAASSAQPPSSIPPAEPPP